MNLFGRHHKSLSVMIGILLFALFMTACGSANTGGEYYW